jgi:hypothetical protein
MWFAGVAACFYINSFSFAAVIISLMFIKPNSAKSAEKAKPPAFR